MSLAEGAPQDELANYDQPINIPAYPENYTGYIDELNPELLAGLGKLMRYLNPDYGGEPIPAEALQAQLEQPARQQIIAIREGYLAGTASVSVGWELYAGQFVQLGAVVVHPAFRGVQDDNGMAVIDHILNQVDAFARRNDAGQVLFEVDPANTRARHAYERWGAERVDTAFYVRQVPSE